MTHKELLELADDLRCDGEMMCDGAQKNLTELWHSDVVTNAAQHSYAAANAIPDLIAQVEELRTILELGVQNYVLHGGGIDIEDARAALERMKE